MKILLVDGKSQSLKNYTELFLKHQCQAVYFTDPLQAIKSISKHQFDVILSAHDLQKTSAFNLLKAVSIKFPTLVRIAYIANNTSTEKAAEIAGNAELSEQLAQLSHYLFDKNTTVKAVISTVLALEHSNKRITKDVIVKAVANVKSLPSPPKIYLQLNAILKNSNTDSEKIADIIRQDPALVAKVLQFSNNTFMPNGKKLTNITEAITKMGVDTLSCIVMTAEMFTYQPDIPNFSLEAEQLHSLAVARFSASLVEPDVKHDALLAGLLHDIGKLVLFEIDKALTLKYFDNGARTSSDILLEQKIFATDHCQIGAYLLHLWSFPYDIIDAILNHHNPEKLLSDNFSVAQAVYLADCLLKACEPDQRFIEHFKLADKLETLQKKSERFQH
ncbi:MAG: HDOD domain-containing protein [Thalassotalea sp.]